MIYASPTRNKKINPRAQQNDFLTAAQTKTAKAKQKITTKKKPSINISKQNATRTGSLTNPIHPTKNCVTPMRNKTFASPPLKQKKLRKPNRKLRKCNSNKTTAQAF
jgi:hypothetical protein